ncbi:cap-specific mRNA (nucleoside-2'-O-)-methyltransferase 1-like isoform X2 [Halichondria panicea]|uniref:cap-specific mRNA (nucleoside-2'-O-)-methyltransferase 1-like isoform X2 n=1 Tax=Halichondria panicea TaxID=6063 RepID=UPI00312BA2B1
MKRMRDTDSPTGVQSTKAPKMDYSNVVQRMMASMGYKPGAGLGKEGGGITQPIEDSAHKGRRGFGFSLIGLEKEGVDWEPEELNCDQKPVWLVPSLEPVPTIEDMESWLTIGVKKNTVADETHFCDSNILQQILVSKSVFDDLSTKEFLDARLRSNPYETIKGAIFQNRAGMKMANIDAAFDWMFTNPRSTDGKPVLSSMDILYYADVCAGPGGFSEYVLWKKKWRAKGFGFTLKDPAGGSDFKLDQFLSAPCETFDPHYGVDGYDGDGDITRPDNLEAFKHYVLDITNGQGVHFVMADGGISVEGQENVQELLTKQLVLCQYTCALSILATGGNFVCKVFDMFTPFSVGLLYLLYRCFHKICIFKPVTSRPANSERYVVGIGLRSNTQSVCEYMFSVNERLLQLRKEYPGNDVLHVVSPEVLSEKEEFVSYITSFNDSFGMNQILNLRKIQSFVNNSGLFETRQAEIRARCLELWKIPSVPRTVPLEKSALEHFNWILQEYRTKSGDGSDLSVLLSTNFECVTMDKLSFLKDIHSWKWCWACGKRFMLIGLGGSGQLKRDTVYIVDVLSIHNEVVGSRPFKERVQLAENLCRVVNKPCRKNSVMLKPKPYYRITKATEQFHCLKKRQCKGEGSPCLGADVNVDSFVVVRGIIFQKHVSDPWHLHLSRSGHLYYYNGATKESTYDCPTTSISSYLNMVARRCLWLLSSDAVKNFMKYSLSLSEEDAAKHLTLAYLSGAIEQAIEHHGH